MRRPLPFLMQLVFASALLAVSTLALIAVSLPRDEETRQRFASLASEILRELGSE
jgi:hypothetical protein